MHFSVSLNKIYGLGLLFFLFFSKQLFLIE
jgi:hypothetical protein